MQVFVRCRTLAGAHLARHLPQHLLNSPVLAQDVLRFINTILLLMTWCSHSRMLYHRGDQFSHAEQSGMVRISRH